MANRYSVVNGDLYTNGVVNEMKVSTGSDIRIKASGTGSERECWLTERCKYGYNAG